MSWQFSAHIIPLILGAVVSMLLAGYAWKNRTTTGAVRFVPFMLTVSKWALSHAIKDKMFWNSGRLFGAATVTLAWYVVSLRLSNRSLSFGRHDLPFLRIGKI